MTVTLAGRTITDPAQLSPRCQQVLRFIDGGPEWLAWALASTSRRYAFADETLLLETVQSGLHASPLTLLPRLMTRISPVKLMTLGPNDLDLLARYEAGEHDDVLDAQIHRIRTDHYLADMAYLMTGTLGLREFQLETSPLFQCMDFGESLALAETVIACPTLGIPLDVIKEAGAFAAAQARTPVEFGDYLRLYARCASSASTPEGREQAATATMQALLPALLGALDCPQVDGLPSPAEVAASLATWLQDRPVGFDRISLAAQQVAANTSGDLADPPVAAAAATAYLDRARAFLTAHRPTQGRLAQDGRRGTFQIDADGVRAVLQVDHGVVSLQFFGPAPTAGVAPEAPTA
ncbi:hypothetical protein ACPEH1_08575 [Stenotrophomonas sp. NPDC077421]|uniref:hypothetical protein n=1 Tax=Stenotrophomonas sp. NPDC077421 TaxID=3414699 RepID=UPI003C2E6CFE